MYCRDPSEVAQNSHELCIWFSKGLPCTEIAGTLHRFATDLMTFGVASGFVPTGEAARRPFPCGNFKVRPENSPGCCASGDRSMLIFNSDAMFEFLRHPRSDEFGENPAVGQGLSSQLPPPGFGLFQPSRVGVVSQPYVILGLST